MKLKVRRQDLVGTAGDKPGSLSLGPVQRLVDPGADPLEESLVSRLADGLYGELHLLLALSLGHVISSNWRSFIN